MRLLVVYCPLVNSAGVSLLIRDEPVGVETHLVDLSIESWAFKAFSRRFSTEFLPPLRSLFVHSLLLWKIVTFNRPPIRRRARYAFA